MDFFFPLAPLLALAADFPPLAVVASPAELVAALLARAPLPGLAAVPAGSALVALVSAVTADSSALVAAFIAVSALLSVFAESAASSLAACSLVAAAVTLVAAEATARGVRPVVPVADVLARPAVLVAAVVARVLLLAAGLADDDLVAGFLAVLLVAGVLAAVLAGTDLPPFGSATGGNSTDGDALHLAGQPKPRVALAHGVLCAIRHPLPAVPRRPAAPLAVTRHAPPPRR